MGFLPHDPEGLCSQVKSEVALHLSGKSVNQELTPLAFHTLAGQEHAATVVQTPFPLYE